MISSVRNPPLCNIIALLSSPEELLLLRLSDQMSAEFSYSVEFGLRLAKRLNYGRSNSKRKATAQAESLVVPPLTSSMSKTFSDKYLPTSPMMYAHITNPQVVDNPEVPSYQPYVHGKCNPPALVPLEMHGVSMDVDCFLDTAFVTLSGVWRVHCVAAGKKCHCRLVVPFGEQGSVLGVEVDVAGLTYHTHLVALDDLKNIEGLNNIAEDRSFLKSNIYTLKIPKVEGGSYLKVKVSWSQKLLYQDGQFCLNIPFRFPGYVVPAKNCIVKRERIQLNVNSGTTGTEILCSYSSHPLKQLRRHTGKVGFLYEADVKTWSSANFKFAYVVPVDDIFGGVLLQSPSMNDVDQRDMFCFYLCPGNNQKRKVFAKEIVFLVDISGSMMGAPLESAKNALLAAMSKLSHCDSFNIIGFNADTRSFSSSLVPATKEAIANATQWININFTAEDGTNILLPLTKAVEMLPKSSNAVPLIFLITDGSVQNDRHICDVLKAQLLTKGPIHPRIYTLGIGSYCNHYFLKMLAQIGRGSYDASYDADDIEFRMQKLFKAAGSVILANISINDLQNLDTLELYPHQIPDLQRENPVKLFGRYNGEFPDSVKVCGMLADVSSFSTELEVLNAKDIPLDKIFAKEQSDQLTADAWLSQNEQLEKKVAQLSLQTGFPSEYTRVILLECVKEKQASDSVTINVYNNNEVSKRTTLSNQNQIICMSNLGIGFGDLVATANNAAPGVEKKPLDSADILVQAASNCCSICLDRCCCMCFIQFMSKMNDQCTIVFSQLCAALACFECIRCCFDLCDSCICN